MICLPKFLSKCLDKLTGVNSMKSFLSNDFIDVKLLLQYHSLTFLLSIIMLIFAYIILINETGILYLSLPLLIQLVYILFRYKNYNCLVIFIRKFVFPVMDMVTCSYYSLCILFLKKIRVPGYELGL